ncbi:MAG: hypothetical protein J6B75_08180 [Ruminococcus sp.]|nr:hypothetical protein [Ruminococcus sp.]
MKKIITFLVSSFLLTSCSSQTNDKAVSEPIEQAPTEHVFTEYQESDFTDVPVKLNKQETEPPVAVKSFDLTGIEFEKKKSPCTLPENRNKYLSQVIIDGQHISFVLDEEPHPDAEKDYFAPLFEPTLPEITAAVFDGVYLYYIADYDNICDGYMSHCYDIYKYSTETGENKCVYSCSDLAAEMPFSMKCHNGSLWLMECDEVYTVFRLDEENSEFTDFHEFPKADNATFYNNGNDELVAAFVSYPKTENETAAKYSIWEYIDDSGEWSEKTNDYFQDYALPVMYRGKLISETVDDRNTAVECEDFLLHTGIRGAKLKAVSENQLTFMVEDNISTILYTYNLTDMERYVLDVSNVSRYMSVYPMGDNLIMGSIKNQSFFYAIPELGSYFSLINAEDDETVHVHSCGEKIALIKCNMQNDNFMNTTPNGLIYDPITAPVLKELVVVG